MPDSQERLATSAVEAAEAANALGYPVALKIASVDLPHKTEAGGVILGLQGQHSVTAAYDQIIASAMRHKPGVSHRRRTGAEDGATRIELVIGMVNDPTFGPIMMAGL